MGERIIFPCMNSIICRKIESWHAKLSIVYIGALNILLVFCLDKRSQIVRRTHTRTYTTCNVLKPVFTCSPKTRQLCIGEFQRCCSAQIAYASFEFAECHINEIDLTLCLCMHRYTVFYIPNRSANIMEINSIGIGGKIVATEQSLERHGDGDNRERERERVFLHERGGAGMCDGQIRRMK